MNIRVAPTMEEANDQYLKKISEKLNQTYSKTLDDILTEIRTRRYYISKELLNKKGKEYLEHDIDNRIETKEQNGL